MSHLLKVLLDVFFLPYSTIINMFLIESFLGQVFIVDVVGSKPLLARRELFTENHRFFVHVYSLDQTVGFITLRTQFINFCNIVKVLLCKSFLILSLPIGLFAVIDLRADSVDHVIAEAEKTDAHLDVAQNIPLPLSNIGLVWIQKHH